MDVYFSHSYRDVAINGYFLDLFVEETIALQADQKTDVWCIAKLERYLRETAGFVSIIPARPTDEDATRPGARHRLWMVETGWRYERSDRPA